MARIGILRDNYSYTTREPDSDDEWDRGDDRTEHSINGLSLSLQSDVLDTPFDVKVGDTLYLLYAVYSTGDTFGTNCGYGFEAISLHQTIRLAEENEKAVESGKDNIELELDDGTKIPFSVPWSGYFESLDYVRVERFQVQK